MGASIIKTASQRSKIMASSLPGRGGFLLIYAKPEAGFLICRKYPGVYWIGVSEVGLDFVVCTTVYLGESNSNKNHKKVET